MSQPFSLFVYQLHNLFLYPRVDLVKNRLFCLLDSPLSSLSPNQPLNRFCSHPCNRFGNCQVNLRYNLFEHLLDNLDFSPLSNHSSFLRCSRLASPLAKQPLVQKPSQQPIAFPTMQPLQFPTKNPSRQPKNSPINNLGQSHPRFLPVNPLSSLHVNLSIAHRAGQARNLYLSPRERHLPNRIEFRPCSH